MQSFKNSHVTCHNVKTDRNNSFVNFIHETSSIVQNRKVLSLPLDDSLCSVDNNSEFGKYIIDGLLLSILCIAFYVWFSKYRLRYLLRINFMIFFCLLFVHGFCFCHLQFPEQLKDAFGFICKEDYYERIAAIELSAYMTIFMILVRYNWSLPLNIKMTVENNGSSSKKRRSVKAIGEFFNGIPPVFPNGWIPLIESSHIPKNTSKTVIAIGQKFCVFRGSEGNSYVLDAYCPHLGAELAAGGRVIKECIECPFHEWQFDGRTGRCVKIPYAEKVPDVARMKTWPSCENNGFIFVWYHAENKDPSWTMPSLTKVESGEWKFRGRTEHEVHCHLQEIPENGADIAHLNVIHTKSVFLKQYPLHQFGDPILKHIDHEWEPLGWEPDEERPHIGIIKLNQRTRIGGFNFPCFNLYMNIEQIGPATVHLHFKTLFGKAVLLQHIIPEGPLNHRIIHLLYTEARFPQLPADLLIHSESIMIGRDIDIWDRKRFLKSPILVKEDKLIKRFRIWYSQFYTENSLTLRDIRERSLEW